MNNQHFSNRRATKAVVLALAIILSGCDTVGAGIGTGALIGGVAGAGIAVAGGGNKQDILKGVGIGATVGGAAGGIDGYLTEQKEQAGRQNIRRAQADAANVRQENARLQIILDDSRRMLEEGQTRMQALRSKVAARKISAKRAHEERAREERNIVSLNQSLVQARERRAQYAQTLDNLRQTKEDTRDMDREIAQMDQKINQLESTVNAYKNALEVSKA